MKDSLSSALSQWSSRSLDEIGSLLGVNVTIRTAVFSTFWTYDIGHTTESCIHQSLMLQMRASESWLNPPYITANSVNVPLVDVCIFAEVIASDFMHGYMFIGDGAQVACRRTWLDGDVTHSD